jgi:predicted aconitase
VQMSKARGIKASSFVSILLSQRNMTLDLTERDYARLGGDFGPAAKMAMSILVRMAKVYRARTLLDITQAHIDSSVYVGPANLEFAERLAGLGAQVAVPTTLNVSGLDEHHWQEWAVPADWADKAHRQMIAYQSMGCIPTWTCAPYQTQWAPKFGEQVAWGESNAIAFANSVIGARTERYPDMLDICCAVTGRAPAVGLHLTENRAGQVLVRLSQVPVRVQEADAFYTVLGFLIGQIAKDEIPVVEGITVSPSEDQLKALGATAASSGRVALFHIVGVTPEAPTSDVAFQGGTPRRRVEITMDDLRSAWRELSTADGERLDMVVLGSPHLSIVEFRQLVALLNRQQLHPDVQLLVTTSRGVALLAQKAGLLDALSEFGGKVTVDTCILTTPMLPSNIKRLMTNSGKYAYYSPSLLGAQVLFGSLEDCVRSAVAGRVVRDDSLWNG